MSKNSTQLNSDTIYPEVEADSLVAQTVKNLPAMQEIQVHSLGQEDPLEKGMGTPSSVLAWRIPWTEAGYSHGVIDNWT